MATLAPIFLLNNHWFMPYKVQRGRLSFQCGTTKLPKVPTWSSPWPLKQKLSLQLIFLTIINISYNFFIFYTGHWKIDPHSPEIQVGSLESSRWLGQVGLNSLAGLDQICRFSWTRLFWVFLANIIGLSKLSYLIGPLLQHFFKMGLYPLK